MNYYPPGGHAAAGSLCYPHDDDAGGEAATAAATAAAGDTTSSSLADMMIADYSTDDLFELAWEQGGGRAGASGSTTMQPPAAFSLWSSPPPEVRFDPPSEDEMASWLCAIVGGEELAILNDDDGRRDVPAKGSGDASTTTDKKAEKLPVTAEAKSTKKEIRKPLAGGSSRRSHHGEAHNLTEKRRRHKINERLKTLQQLVPGCYKSNQVSTLDQTIKYMKSLQHHVQAMSIGPAHPAAAAMYPVVPSQYVPPGAPVAMPMSAAPMVLGHPPTMVSFGTMLLPLPRYPAAVPVMTPAAAAPPRAPEGARSSASHQQGSSSSKGKGSSSMRHQKQ